MIRSSPLGRAELEIPRRRLSARLRALGIRDERVLEAVASVPRHLLIPEPLRGQAYRDGSLPIGAGQTISAPSTVASMTQALELPRRRLSERLRALGIRDERVLEAVASVPRHLLIPEPLRGQAYRDGSLPIGAGQTISAPSTVASMTQALELTGSESVLEIGTGSGYQAAILSRLVAQVVSIERVPQLAARARTALDTLGVSNVVVHLGDGTAGRTADAPFDAIVVTAGGPEVPQPLLAQLAPHGCLVGPFGARDKQKLIRMRCDGLGNFSREELGPCRFVELLGTHGWAAA